MPASDWWARKLGNAPPAAPSPQQHLLPSRAPIQPLPEQYVEQGGDGVLDVLARAAMETGGSKRVKEDSGSCPECGSGNYFARKYNENGMPMRIEAAPHCYDCGYPIIQAGSAHGGATSARAEGKTQAARQLGAGHKITVQDGARSITY